MSRKGIPNRATRENLIKCMKKGFDPFEQLIRFAMGDFKELKLDEYTLVTLKDGSTVQERTISPELMQKSTMDICSFLYPKRKSIEITGEDGDPIQTSHTITVEAVKRAMAIDPAMTPPPMIDVTPDLSLEPIETKGEGLPDDSPA